MERLSPPPPRPLLLSGVEELQVLQPAELLGPVSPGDSAAELSGPSLGPSAAACAPESWHWRTRPARGRRKKQDIDYTTGHNYLMST